jgi:hypothetical protein
MVVNVVGFREDLIETSAADVFEYVEQSREHCHYGIGLGAKRFPAVGQQVVEDCQRSVRVT